MDHDSGRGENRHMDRAGLAQFLRARRAALQPEDVGMPRGQRRRTSGLRREEVAVATGMSADYYTRLEQFAGPVPSEPMLAALAQGLRLSLAERDYLFQLAGYAVPARVERFDHVNPGMMRIIDSLDNTAAMVLNELTETLRQTQLHVAIFGDEMAFTGFARSKAYRWFTDPASRNLYPADDHESHSKTIAGTLRLAYARQGVNSRAHAVVSALLASSGEFHSLWESHVVPSPYYEAKKIIHPRVGMLELQGQTLLDPDQSQSLLVMTAVPGSETCEKLQLLSAINVF
ncbi:helix-turn-helix transcriptional regulator [Lentzea sp. NPDC059081]|uniref:helix-turn-helix transcriptional regulator n=1 Tax=Lentzea sp. NPDC059081 TaxID=3346719 RepID=UPI0036C049AF